MIPGTALRRYTSSWRKELAEAVTDPAELLRLLRLDPALSPADRTAATIFPLRVPRGFVARMRPGDPHDPLLRQVLPLGVETEPAAVFDSDPLDERAALRAPALLQKYHGRALLLAAGGCAVHCRYCFRREFSYSAAGAGRWRQALAWLAADASVTEVILSGGDPLLLSNERLGALLQGLSAIPHLRRLRIHSRLPIVLPARVDAALTQQLRGFRRKVILVTHANHPQELDATVADAMRRLAAAGVTLLNQAVLLRGVNDTTTTLAALSETLFDLGVLPYYLHLLDPTPGTAHFQVEQARAVALVERLRRRLPGYLAPRLAREEAGKPAKTLLL